MVGRKVCDEAEAVELIEEARRRGVRASVVGKERGIDGRSVHAWSMTLAKRKQPRRAGGLLELVPVVSSPVARSYRVWVGELSVEVSDDFDEHSVRRLVAALQAC